MLMLAQRSYHQGHLSGQQTSHGVANQHQIRVFGLMRLKPCTQIVPSNLDGLVRFVPWVQFGVDNMGLGKRRLQVVVDMGRERLEGCVVAHEAMDVDDEEDPARVVAAVK